MNHVTFSFFLYYISRKKLKDYDNDKWPARIVFWYVY